MSNSLGTLLTAHAYTPSGYTAATAARAAYEAGQPATASLPKKYPLLAIVGDMVSDPDAAYRDQEEGTAIASRFWDVSNLVVGSNATYFVCLGDNVYDRGELTNYVNAYDKTFGRVLYKTLPTPGNHEYVQPDAADYFTYFGALAGPAGVGYYAVNIGRWRLYSLNSNGASFVAPGSAQMLWLIGDFAAHPGVPKIVVFHHPRWTDGGAAVTDDAHYDYLWQLCVADGHVQMILNGHDHNYQRWDTIKPSTPSGNTSGVDGSGNSYPPVTDTAHGITQFVVGCGGNNFFGLVPPANAGSAGNPGRRTWGHDRAFGVLFLRLGPASWDYLFRSIDNQDLDSGTVAVR
jgi:hypothetical protein